MKTTMGPDQTITSSPCHTPLHLLVPERCPTCRDGQLQTLSRAGLVAQFPDNLSTVIAAADMRKDTLTRDLITVFAGTGLRFEELAHLRPLNIHWDTPKPKIEIRAYGDWSPKDPREVKRIPMSSVVQEVIRRRTAKRKPDEYIFQNTVGGKVHVNRARERLQRLFPLVGIDQTARRLHWHSFRNYFVIRCLKKGYAVNNIMRWTGHDSAAMVLHYAEAMSSIDEDADFE